MRHSRRLLGPLLGPLSLAIAAPLTLTLTGMPGNSGPAAAAAAGACPG
jgi:hypothetical protein